MFCVVRSPESPWRPKTERRVMRRSEEYASVYQWSGLTIIHKLLVLKMHELGEVSTWWLCRPTLFCNVWGCREIKVQTFQNWCICWKKKCVKIPVLFEWKYRLRCIHLSRSRITTKRPTDVILKAPIHVFVNRLDLHKFSLRVTTLLGCCIPRHLGNSLCLF